MFMNGVLTGIYDIRNWSLDGWKEGIIGCYWQNHILKETIP